MYNPADTICAPATAVGSGAVSMIRVSGADSLCAVDRVVRFDKGSAADSRGYTLKHGDIPGIDEVVVGIYRAPHSYTGEDSAEICCHASPFIAGRILDELCASGCRLAEAGEFTRRAFTNGKMDLAQAEAVADLIASGSVAQHRVALNQLRGGYSAELAEIRSELLELTSLIELELDFSEEDVEFADRDRLASLLDDVIGRCTTLADSFKAGNAIRNGVPVAIVGAPNSGKSTLLNALLRDDRALVSDIPGTTRDTIEETCVVGGVLLRFIDTAGIRETRDEVERMGIDRALSKAAQAEIVLGVVDATVPPAPGVAALTDCVGDASLLPDGIVAQIEKIVSVVDLSRQKLVLLLNKCDKTESAAAGSVGRSMELKAFLRGRFPAVAFFDEISSGGISDRGVPGEGVLNDKLSDGGIPKGRISEDVVSTGRFSDHLDSNDVILAYNKNVSYANINVLSADYQKNNPTVLSISAKYGIGLEDLRKVLVSLVGNVTADGVLVTNARHAAALRDAAASLRAVRSGLDALPGDLLAEDLRAALASLGSITGEICPEEVLGAIFSRFCVGK